MARGTNSSKYIQSIGSQDVRQHVAFPARGAVREGFAVCCEWGFLFCVSYLVCCIAHPTPTKQPANVEGRGKRDTQSFSVSVLSGTRQCIVFIRNHHVVWCKHRNFPIQIVRRIYFIAQLCAWPHFADCFMYHVRCSFVHVSFIVLCEFFKYKFVESNELNGLWSDRDFTLISLF